MIFLGTLILGSACVTQKKYDELLTEKVRLEAEKADCDEELHIVTTKLTKALGELDKMKTDTVKLGKELEASAHRFEELKQDYDELDKYYNNLLQNSGRLNRELAQKAQELLALEESLEQEKTRSDNLSRSLQERSRRITELEDVLAQKEAAVKSLKTKVTNALLNFEENDLKVEVRNGKVYVSLAEQLLFGSGSIEVDRKGENALKQLAQVLKENPDIQIMVEGHTDNVPVSKISKYMQDNWDLSVMRATAITRILTSSGVAPGRISTSGRGEHSPITSNKTNEGRSANRRTEIILTPKLDELFHILERN
ncbi:MAG: OmpA family protein [Cytophagales bacterium]|nr:OmpA family protein [Cytophagales bacterium]